ncbi:MAG TPA: OsmC family protein [Casimicrobiaceae bacterium]|jgi:putative redox protein|nr:OsmC family protein [Casimicrobiaceae bacterium]
MSSTLRPVRTAKASRGAIAHELSIGAHVLLCDEPPASGGDDLGPNPHELLDAALASCTALTLMLYARRKGWPLQGVEAEVSHDQADGVYRMRRDIRLIGGLAADERARLLEIANKCPVHRTLSGRFEITSALIS